MTGESKGETAVLFKRIKRPVAATVLVAFLSLVLQPLAVLAQDRPPSPAAQRQVESGEEKFSRTLREIHDILKEVAPAAAMPHMTAKNAERQLRAIGPNIRIETEAPKPLPGVDVAEKVKQLRARANELAALEERVREGFEATGRHIKANAFSAEIQARHTEALAQFEARNSQFKVLVNNLGTAADQGGNVQAPLAELGTFMAKHPGGRTHAPADPANLPFGARKPAARKPHASAGEFQSSGLFDALREERLAAELKKRPLRLAQSGGLSGIGLPATVLPQTPQAEDLGETEDIKLTPAIRAKAAELGNQPVLIYNWVRNNVDFVPTYGSIQGADLTLQTMRGNAFDTASLLVALLRAANVPARYVYGTIQMPAERVMNWAGGATVPFAATDLMGQGGIPVIGLTSAGRVSHIRLEHVWVEAFVDYVPSRGAVNRQGDTWVPLDASFKQYAAIPSLLPADIGAGIQSASGNFVQSASRAPDGAWSTGFNAGLMAGPIAAVRDQVAAILGANPDAVAIEELIGGRRIVAAESPIFAGTLPYTVVATGARMAGLPANLRVSANVQVMTAGLYGEDGDVLLSRLISLPSLGYSSLNLSHVAATPQDAAVWDSYANAQTFPPYLINMKSRLSIEGAVVAESGPVRAAQEVLLRVSFSGAGHNRSVTFHITVGDEIEIGLNGAGQAPEQGLALRDRDFGTAAGNLYITAKGYWTQQDFQERILGRLHGVATTRLPSAGIFAAPLSVIDSFGVPRIGSYHSRQVDIKLSHLAAAALDGNPKKASTFVMHAGNLGSANEGAVIEQVFGKPLGQGSNTMRLLQLANEQGMRVYHLKPDNIAAHRSSLQHAPEVMTDIDNALAAGLEVIIPQTRQTNGAWSGSGYIMLDPFTSSGDYRVSGGLSGNFADDSCQRVTKPVKIAVPDIALIWWILFGWMVDDDFNFNGAGIATALATIVAVVAIVAIVAVAAPVIAAAGTAVAVFTRASFAALAYFFSSQAMAEGSAESCSCDAERPGERGGGFSFFTEVHNACADRYTDFPGTDIRVAGVNFDGIRTAENPPGTLYEIKTGMFYGTIKTLSLTRPSVQKFLDVLKAKAIIGYYRERFTATHVCTYEFRYGVRDPAMMIDLQQHFLKFGDPSDAARVFPNGC